MPQIVAPSHVSKPPRNTDPVELGEYRDLLDANAGALVSDGETYETRGEAVKVAGSIKRGLTWLGFDEKVRARIGQTPDGQYTWALRVSDTADEDDEEIEA